MGWHDSLAARAIAMGKTAAEFKSGARRKAYAACLFLAVAGAVWYFVSWPWAVIPAAVAAWNAFQSMSATMIAGRLEKLAQRPTSSSLPAERARGTCAPLPPYSAGNPGGGLRAFDACS